MDMSLQCDIVPKMHKLHLSRRKVTLQSWATRWVTAEGLCHCQFFTTEKTLINEGEKKKISTIINIKRVALSEANLGASSANRGELSEHPRTDTEMSFIDQMATVKGKASLSMGSLIHRAIICLCFEHH